MLWRSTSRGPVLLTAPNDDAEVLGGVAAVVWEVLDGPLAADDIRDAVGTVVGSPIEITDALAEMRAADLVIEVP